MPIMLLTDHALHAVGQEHHEATLSDPLALTGRDELINDTLRRVIKVTELSFPAY